MSASWEGTLAESPILEGDALAAVRHRESHVQIIASAGSGKTGKVRSINWAACSSALSTRTASGSYNSASDDTRPTTSWTTISSRLSCRGKRTASN
jgi:hypothetical protein